MVCVWGGGGGQKESSIRNNYYVRISKLNASGSGVTGGGGVAQRKSFEKKSP